MNEGREPQITRIFVAIDTSSHGSAALEAAALLATESHAELHGLFIEDLDLLRLAGLPFAREIDCSSGVCRPLDVAAMEQQLRTQAEGVRLAIVETAQRTNLRWTFRISRGNVAQTMLTETSEADLLLIGQKNALPSPAQSRPNVRRGGIMLVDEGCPSTHRLFDTARRLARYNADVIVALITGETGLNADEYAELSAECYVQRCDLSVDALLRSIRHWQPQLLLLARSSQFASASTINTLVARLPCPLILVQ